LDEFSRSRGRGVRQAVHPASGSLKDLADACNVSYPTLRLRPDRLIEKIKILDSQKIHDDFERQLRAHFADGKLDLQVFKNF